MVRLILYNIQYLEGNDGKNWEYLRVWRRIFHPKYLEFEIGDLLIQKNPDIVAFTEIGGGSFLERENYLNHFKKLLGMNYSVKRVKYKLKGMRKILKDIPLFSHQGNAIISKRKLTDIHTKYVKEGVKNGVIEVTAHVPQKIILFLVHLSLGRKTREKQIRDLTKLVRDVKEPFIVLGDFNTLGGTKELKKFLKETKLTMYSPRKNTFPSFHPTKRLDYVLTSDKIKVKTFEIMKTDLSDHLPIFVEFEVKK